MRIIEVACEKLNIKCNLSSTSNEYTFQGIANKIGVYFRHKEAALYFTSPTPIPGIKMDQIPWLDNVYGVRFDFDKHCFFHKNFEGQVEIIKEFINDLLSKIEN